MRIKQMKLKNKNGLNIYGFNVKSDNFPGPGLAKLLSPAFNRLCPSK